MSEDQSKNSEAHGRPIAFVTGARRGIGRGISWALADAGFDVVINDLVNDDDAQATQAGISSRGARSAFVQGDIADVDRLDALAAAAWNAFGRIDCLVNNAGVSVLKRGDLLDMSLESYDRNLDINLRGPFFLTQRIARRMIEDRSAEHYRSIICISSVNAAAVSITRGEYCISKTGVSMMARLFAARLASEHIAVHEIRPGIIQTEMAAASAAAYDSMLKDGTIPFARWGQPADIGKAAAALASGAFGYSTGSQYEVDGGFHLKQL